MHGNARGGRVARRALVAAEVDGDLPGRPAQVFGDRHRPDRLDVRDGDRGGGILRGRERQKPDVCDPLRFAGQRFEVAIRRQRALAKRGEDGDGWVARIAGVCECPAHKFACAAPVGRGVGRLKGAEQAGEGGRVPGRPGRAHLGGAGERDDRGAVAARRIEGIDQARGGLAGALELRGALGRPRAGSDRVINDDHEFLGAGSELRRAEERAREPERKEKDHKAAEREKQPLLELETPALAADGLLQEAHGAPRHGRAATTQQEMDQDRQRECGDAAGEDERVKKTHGRG